MSKVIPFDREQRAVAPRDGPAKIIGPEPAIENAAHDAALPPYAELHCLSNFTFLRGASKAKELFARAAKLGYEALAITDECSLAGIVRALEAAQKYSLKLIVGAEFSLRDGPRFVLLAADQAGYTALCGLITTGRRAAKKGEYVLRKRDVEAMAREGLLALFLGPGAGGQGPGDKRTPAPGPWSPAPALEWLRDHFAQRCWLAVELHRGARDARKLEGLRALSAQTGVPLVACGDVHMHARSRRALQDALTAIRLRTTIAEAGLALFPNGERHLRSREALAKLYPRELLEESARIARLCTFDLGQLKYEYPHELVPPGRTAAEHLRALTEQGVAWRWPEGVAPKVRDQIEHELALIAELKYESYFLTVHDIVRFARAQGILCQGRGSAANSAVCFALGITEVDPSRMNMLFERFISKERNEPPDIDIDFEHERREEVIQYIYAKYGRDRAALAATVISYRGKSTIRDLGKALGLDLDQVEQLSSCLQWWDGLEAAGPRLSERGFDPESPVIRRLLVLASQLVGFPRHLSQHVGGFVISEHPLSTLVPVENASMPDRTVIQWDKDDLDTLGLLKVDCLALGMLTCIRKCFDLVHAYRNATPASFPRKRESISGALESNMDSRFRGNDERLTLATIPAEDPQTYEMIQRADTIGVFQIESRAQMSMLPRLKPSNFYDLVIEVAIVRPGPIQGKMVHPFLRRRQGLEPVVYPSEALREVFGRTLGVPIFQEQVMQVAIVAAGFTPGEADQLRRSMAAWSRRGGMEHFQRRILDGMAERGYTAEFANQIFEQIKGFASYGFPESHAASFALLVYASCWLKRHEPAAFACALLNSQPMGFYAPGQILTDAKQHGVEVRPPCVVASAWDSSLETTSRSRPAIRLGLREIRGFSEDCAKRIEPARRDAPFRDVEDLVARASLDKREREKLAASGALRALAGHRRRAYWSIAAVERPAPLLEQTRIADDRVTLAPEPAGDAVRTDYATLGYTLGTHPLKLLRRQLAARRARLVRDVKALPPGSRVRAVGLVNLRQRPSTASGTTFITLEDESGWLNVIVWQRLGEKQRRVLLESQLLAIDGVFESADGVSHVIAHELHDWSAMLDGLDSRSRDFH